MKVSERIQQIRRTTENMDVCRSSKGIMESQLIRLEVEIIEALLIARQKGYQAGIDYVESVLYEKRG